MRQSILLFGENSCEGVNTEDGECWRTRPLPLNAKVLLVKDSVVNFYLPQEVSRCPNKGDRKPVWHMRAQPFLCV